MSKHKPLSFLIHEHILIEKALALFDDLLHTSVTQVEVLDRLVDFFRTYADRCHHGKEENILFTQSREKTLTPELKKLLEDLEFDHKKGRSLVTLIDDTNQFFKKGDFTLKDHCIKNIKELLSLYFRHIEKENTIFFPGILPYFSASELEKMYDAFENFDQKMIHERYQKIVDDTKKIIKS
ncbi:MAG: hemerythrin domain-containing protein [Chlamydiota bacterium]